MCSLNSSRAVAPGDGGRTDDVDTDTEDTVDAPEKDPRSLVLELVSSLAELHSERNKSCVDRLKAQFLA